jgi:enoyl-[acyl-carrier protein] reductase II
VPTVIHDLLKGKQHQAAFIFFSKEAIKEGTWTPTTMLQPAVRTRITSLLGCRYPILLPGMSWISTPELVAAVSNAGGCGILATGPLNDQETRQAIHRIRELSDKPFGIGATLLMPGATENAKVALEEQVPLINVSLGKPDWIAEACKQYGGKVLATVTNAKHAGRALDSGADALMITGHEAAAHGGDVTSLVLVAAMAEQFPQVPLVAAGGFANGRGLAAALALGADAVAMGSRMSVTADSPLAQPMKEAVARAKETDTLYGSNFDGIPARVLKTPIAQKRMKSRPNPLTVLVRAFQAANDMKVPLWKILPGMLVEYDKIYAMAQFGAATKDIMAATVDGNVQEGVQFIGQCAGLIHDIPTVEELVQRIITDAKETSLQNASLFNEDDHHDARDSHLSHGT